jgi:prenyltransferase beta subunit
MNKQQLETRFNELSKILRSEMNQKGFWTGELSSSALAVAVAIAALHFYNREQNREEIQRGFEWLKKHINTDGSFGDTPESKGNISTSLLVFAAVNLYAHEDESLQSLQNNIAGYLQQNNIDVASDRIADSILKHYKKDYTFSVPILTMCGLCGIPQKNAFRKVPQLPFELALLPRKFYRLLNLSVVSYAIPALIAVGIVISRKKRSPKLFRWIRNRAEKRALKILHKSMPASGGFLEAIPLTAFVSLSLIEAGYRNLEVVEKGIAFLKRMQRADGGFPIDVDLSTWVTSLSVKALGNRIDEVLDATKKERLVNHYLSGQNRKVHPFNGTSPGGWGWTTFSGSVPDGDDTPGAMLALMRLTDPKSVFCEILAGGAWLLKLQNKDGGFPTFSRGWGKLPFDQSCADLTGHAFLAIASMLNAYEGRISTKHMQRFERSLERNVSYLDKNQRKDGAWLPLWFGNQNNTNHENPVYGTARILTYLNDAKALLKSSEGMVEKLENMIGKAEQFLIDVQNTDGSWGGDKNIPGTIEETALSVSALQKDKFEPLTNKALEWLDSYFTKNGLVSAPIGLYFASLWYDEKMYPLTAYLEAVVRSGEDTSGIINLSRDV